MTRIREIFRQLPIPFAVLVLLITSTFLIIGTFIGLKILNKTIYDVVVAQNERTLTVVGAVLEERVNLRREALHWFSTQSTLDLESSPAIQSLFDYGVIMTDEDGQILWSSSGDTSWQPHPEMIPDHPYLLTENTEFPLLILHYAAENHHLYGAFSLESIDVNSLFNNPRDHHFKLFVSDTSGQVLMYPQGWNNEKHRFNLITAKDANKTVSHNGEKFITISEDLVIPNLRLTATVPWSAITNIAIRRILLVNALPLSLLGITLLLITFIYLGLNQIVRPLSLLGNRAALLAWGNYDAVQEPVGGIAAIMELQNTLIQMANRLRQSDSHRQNYISAVIQGQEEERARIARDLHDETIQALIALGQQLETVERWIAKDTSKAVEKLKALQDYNRTTLDDIRRLIGDMRPTYLTDLGFITALKKLCQDFKKTGGINVSCVVPESTIRFTDDIEIVLYRICQEALANVTKHAHASAVQINLILSDVISLTIIDNGQGFEIPDHPLTLAAKGHYGLITIVERVRMIQGNLLIDSSKQSGTRLSVTIPREGSTWTL